MENFNECVDFVCRQISNQNKNQLTDEELDSLLSFLEITLQNPKIKAISIGPDVIDTHLNDEDKLKIKKKIQTIFNIKMNHCIAIEGNEQKKRDKNWWYREKVNNDQLYWKTYKDGLHLGPNVKATIDNDTDVILNYLFNPKKEQATSRYGMVVGHVQSGKTSNYAGLICKAADAGYRCFIIIAGIHNNLRTQTQKRIKNIFSSINNKNQPIFLTTDELDFNKKDVQKFGTLNFDNCSKPIFLIIKKNTSTLKNVINWLNSRYPDKINAPLLLIDDEADNASINTKEQEDPTIINQRIRELLQKFHRSSYVGYTATPFANIFIDDCATNDKYGKDLFPDDFIITLDAPDNYYGAEKIFLKKYEGIRIIDDFENYVEIKNSKEITMNELPPSLEEAIRCFYINIAIRHLRGDKKKDNSMLIHASRLTTGHQTIAYHVDDYNTSLQRSIQIYGKSKRNNDINLIELQKTYNNLYNCEFSWQDILDEINEIYQTVEIVQEHSLSKIRIEYTDNYPRNIIAIGGNSLSRGFTLEGLSVSYFTRCARAYDTLMQMARWFGYRDGYDDICKIYMTDEIYQNFIDVSEATADLFSDLNEMRLKHKTPKDFGLAVRKHPGTFLITAKNKMKNTEDFTLEYRLDGLTKETNLLPSNEEDLAQNLTVTKNFIETLENVKKPITEYKNKYLWLDVSAEQIRKYLECINLPSDYKHFPVTSIKDYLTKYTDDKWRVLLFGTNNEAYKVTKDISVGIQQRNVNYANSVDDLLNEIKLVSVGSNRQVSGGDAEKYGLLNSELVNIEKKAKEDSENLTRTYIKKNMNNPIMIIHFIKPFKTDNTPKELLDKTYVVLSFCFPKTEKIANSTVKITANTVYIRQMKQMDLFSNDWIDEDE